MDEKAKEIVNEHHERMKAEREKLLAERDNEFAEILQTIDDNQDKAGSKDVLMTLKDRMYNFYDLVLKADMDDSIKIIKEDKRLRGFYGVMIRLFGSRYIQTMVFVFLAGVILTLIPTVIYTSTLKTPKEDITPFRFVPNTLAERKPVYIQILMNSGEVNSVKKTGIYLSDQAMVGDGIRLNTNGLNMYLKREFGLPGVHLKYIGSQKDKKVNIHGYEYTPNYILTKTPSDVQVLKTEDEVKSAKNWKDLTYKEYLSIGSAIDCPQDIPCYVISKASMESRIIAKPFKPSEPEEQQQQQLKV